MEESARSSWFLSRRIFLAGIAATYAIAFGSLWVQVDGLFGERGIAPIARTLQELRAALGGADVLRVPTLLWWSASDRMLDAICAAGIACALLTLLGIVPRVALALDWALYLSLAAPGEPFLSFQWDILLLEAGLLAIFAAPGGLRPFGRAEPPPSSAALFLERWLLFRLMLLSGAVKLLSGDPSWRELEALDHHYWTQPLPHRWSWYAHALPQWTRATSLVAMFAIELGAPFLVFGTRRMKQVAAGAIALLMAAIVATGNYGFFNFLTLVLCVPLLDDRAWRALLRRKSAEIGRDPPAAAPRFARARRIAAGLFVALVLVLTSSSAALRLALPLPAPLAWLHARAAPFASTNAYGLFSVMTKTRPEIMLEGSLDGVEWRPYRFRYKPLELERAPVFAGLHMPRLDWQLWFAALDSDRRWRPRWYEDFLKRLLESSPDVLALLAEDPFAGEPPRFLRSTVWDYRFSTPMERARGIWWQRDGPRQYVPVVTLVDGELQTVRR
jgi:hypothetical protein